MKQPLGEILDVSEFAVTEEYQAKVLAYMVSNPEFRQVAADNLSQELFSNKALQWFFSTVAESPYDLTPTTLQEELIKAAKEKRVKPEEINKYVELYDIIKHRPVPAEEEYIKAQVATFIRTQKVKNAMVESVDLAKSQQWEEIVARMQEAVSAGVQLSDMGHDYFGEIVERVEARKHRVFRRIPTGIPELDTLTYGGVKNRQMSLIVGGTGRGKSVFLQWLARTAVLLNKKVVYFTFELSEEDIADRFDSMFAKVKPQELNDYQEQIVKEISSIGDVYGSSLIIKHFPADSATVSTLKTFVTQLSHSGIVPDMIIMDYLDLVKPHRNYSSAHEEINAITKATVGFAAEYDISVWTATQMNRSGLVMDTPDEAAMAGYVGKQYHADMVLWMAQTKDEKEDELMRLWISKNRNGFAGKTVTLSTNYSYMTFYREEMNLEENADSSQEQEGKSEVDAGQTDQKSTEGDMQLLFQRSESDSSSPQEE